LPEDILETDKTLDERRADLVSTFCISVCF